jgi:hypothetical protein
MKIATAFLCLFLSLGGSLEGGVGSSLARTAARRAAGGFAKRAATRAVSRAPRAITRAETHHILKLDALTHRAPAKSLAQPLTVQRYTTARRAASEIKGGIPPGRHMTASARPGPPMRPQVAQQRYGILGQAPEARETIRLPKGFPVRSGKAHHGMPGVGEKTSPQRVPPKYISVTPLRGKQ